MNRIDRNNYELYFIDFMEGNMPSDKLGEFNTFLDANPDLKEELALMSQIDEVVVQAGNLTFSDKHLLKKSEAVGLDNPSIFEQQSIARMEGDLSSSQAAAFDTYIEDNPKQKKEYTFFAKTKLIADASIKFGNKNDLKRFIIIPLTRSQLGIISSAAAVVAIMFFSFSLWMSFDNFDSFNVAFNDNAGASYKQKSATINGGEHLVRLSPQKDIKPSTIVNKTVVIPLHSQIDRSRNEQAPALLASLTEVVIADEQTFTPMLSIKLEPVLEASPVVIASNTAAPLSVKEYATSVFKKQVLNQDEAAIDPSGLKFGEIADAGMSGISKLSKNRVSFNREVSEDGKLMAFAFDAGFFGISRTSGTKQ